MKFCYTVIFFLGIQLTNAQQFVWAKTYTGTVAPLSGNALAIDGNYNIFTASPVDTTGSLLLKTDANGNELWRTYFHGNVAVREIDISNDQLYVTGVFKNTFTVQSTVCSATAAQGFFLCLFDGSGTLQWLKNCGGSPAIELTDMLITPAGLFVCGAFSGTMTAGTFSAQGNGWQSAFLSRHDFQGNVSKLTTAVSNYSYSSSRICKMDYAHGKITMCGRYVDQIIFDTVQVHTWTNNSYGSRFIADFDPFGMCKRMKPTGSIHSFYSSAKINSDSILLLAGHQSWTNGDEGLVVGLDKDFNAIGSHSYQQPCYGDGTHATDIELIGSNCFVWADMTRGGNCLPGNITNTLCIAKFTNSLNLLYKHNVPGTAKLRAACIKKQGQDLIVSGIIWSGGIKIGPDSLVASTPVMFLAKFSESITSGDSQEELSSPSIRVFPNPGSQVISVTSRQSITTILITDFTGKSITPEIHKQDDTKYEVNLYGFAQGVYFIRINTERGIEVKKVILK